MPLRDADAEPGVPADIPGSGDKRSATVSLIHAHVSRYLRHVTVERGLSVNTIAAYRRDLEAYVNQLDHASITDAESITAADVAGFVHELRDRGDESLATASAARMLSSVKGFHRFLRDEGIVTADVSVDAKPPKLTNRLPKAISIQQMADILATTEGDDVKSLRDKALLELLYATGARISEAVNLNVDDVISETGQGAAEVVRLFGKGRKQRIVPLGSFARDAVDAYLVRARPLLSARGAATPALFLGLRGARLSRQNAWLIIQARAEQSKIRIAISPHTFRHSFATHLLEGGADVRVVQELLGHASVSTTQIYTRVTADTLRDMYTMAHPRAR